MDGFRCDAAGAVPVEFRLAARKAVEKVRPGCIWPAESVFPLQERGGSIPVDFTRRGLSESNRRDRCGGAERLHCLQGKTNDPTVIGSAEMNC